MCPWVQFSASRHSEERVWSDRPCFLTCSPCLSLADAHREFVPRPLSGYMPEEIWRKAGECVTAGCPHLNPGRALLRANPALCKGLV